MSGFLSPMFFLLFLIGGLGLLYGVFTHTAARAAGSFQENKTSPSFWSSSSLGAVGLRIYPPVFFAGLVLIGLLLSLFFSDVLGVNLFLSLVVSGLVCVLILGMFVEWGHARSIRFEERLLDGVDLMIAALQSGETPRQSLDTVADVVRDPVKREMRSLSSKIASGMKLEDAVSGMMREYRTEGVRMFCSILVAKWNAGGDLAPVLTSVNLIMRERLRFRLRIRAQMAGVVLTSYMVGVFPYVVMWCIYMFIPEWVDRLLVHPWGIPLLMMGVCIQFLGFFWIRLMMKVEL